MTTAETRKFFVRVKIVDKDGQIHELSKEEDFKIEWGEDGIGKSKKIVSFEKDDKTYKILVELDEIKKGKFRDMIRVFRVKPVDEQEFEIWSPEKKQQWSKGWYEIGKKRPDIGCDIKAIQRRPTGFIIIGGVAASLLIAGITAFILVKKKKKRERGFGSLQSN